MRVASLRSTFFGQSAWDLAWLVCLGVMVGPLWPPRSTAERVTVGWRDSGPHERQQSNLRAYPSAVPPAIDRHPSCCDSRARAQPPCADRRCPRAVKCIPRCSRRPSCARASSAASYRHGCASRRVELHLHRHHRRHRRAHRHQVQGQPNCAASGTSSGMPIETPTWPDQAPFSPYSCICVRLAPGVDVRFSRCPGSSRPKAAVAATMAPG